MVCPTDTIIDTLKSELRYDDAAGDLFWTKAGRGRRLNRPAGFVGFGGYRSLKFKWEATGKLFEAWADYARAAGEDAGSKKRFAEAMLRRGFVSCRKISNLIRASAACA